MKDQLATPDALVQLRFGCQQPSPFFPLSDPGAVVQSIVPATSFDELPASILKTLVGFASPILLHWLSQLRKGHSSFFFEICDSFVSKEKGASLVGSQQSANYIGNRCPPMGIKHNVQKDHVPWRDSWVDF